MRPARRDTPRTLPARLLTGLAALIGLVVVGALCPGAALAQSPAARSAGVPSAGAQAAGLHIGDGRLLEGNGNDFVMRGVNHAHTWYPGETQSLADVKALGANSVRVVLSDGHRWSENGPADVAAVIEQCKANRLICVLEVHDTTGYAEDAAAGTLDHAADYWIGLKDVLAGQEDYVIVNIGNEPWGNTDPAGWTEPTVAAVKKLRAAGLQHTIMVDAPNWGQDWQGVMRANARSVYDADPTGNLIFSIHMYSVFDTAQEITDYLNAFVDAELPILIGEFGGPADQYGDPDEDTMMATAEQLRLGYLAWSWSGNTDPVLDLALDFDPSRLSGWGERIFHGVNGIAQTSEEATVYGDGAPDDTEAPTAPGAPSVTAVTDSSVTLGWVAATDDTAVSGYDVVLVGDGTSSTVASSTTTTATVTGLTAATTYTFAVHARDAAGNRSARSATVEVTTDGGGTPGGACSVGYRVVGEWPGGFQGEIAVRNTGSAAIGPWTLAFAFADGQTVTNMWGGTATQDAGAVSVAPASYTATIPAGGTVTLGFTARKGDTNTAPAAFRLNGAVCATP
ncbi:MULTISPECIES: cellulase family glycosylhydrolase [Streptomyces]|uniref:Endoglucanase n=1 Tax=Streptomyces coelicolor (strain ATCC BAA-471 / A3(2) / M145) TaxID=100226 RepID=Q8CK53_STRCO|nr:MULTISPECIES: cellulase family glycosylhydrolase [Streptomyces]MYU40080.1 cellulase family glycosylhydrolase [Streptomyces sp. SID7813]MDX2925477.1 cellulase family glycosylhydrolase [Streptomyces sp. NRRL_B-16638]MDX3410837.1 cellulase family glycosylhydrolase [Streptomyces sp. ME02-6977A]NSL82954.1 cellulase family glycosylhydrolase [Streptomyces coelicolor]QFI40816.1 cellulase family glycosylhydrolase [Streptomyces coelicolor A3(2)]